ncbi:MAG: peptidyl-prolyl cis-trans isomerase [Candidatus Zixiibacteriota bacterium]|nr:MAG: peptidyl-prolyl cis-trans isomerase [candidate division Zixibacteria bacterium]
MFEALRKMIFPIIIIVLLFFVAMIVLQWGLDLTGQSRFGTPNVAGTVNGEDISWEAWQSIYNNIYEQQSQAGEVELTDEQVLEIEKAAWYQIVQERLLLQEAAKHNLTITDDDLYLYLRLNPPVYLQQIGQFQTEGTFDYQKYLGAMADPSWAPFWNSVEPRARLDLRLSKMQQLIIEAAVVSENEIRHAFLEGQEQVNVRAIKVSQAPFASPAPRIPEDEVREYWEVNSENYGFDARVILELVMFKKEPSATDWEIAQARARALYDSVVAGADFGDIASTYSEDLGSARDSGSLGWFEQGRMVPAFDSAAFSMNAGDISEPIRTQFGWHVLKHHGYREEEKIPSGKTSPEKVREARVSHILIKAAPGQGTLDNLYNSLADFRVAAEEKGFHEAADEAGLEVINSGPIYEKVPLEILGFAPAAQAFGFHNEVEDISDVLENDGYYFVVRIDSLIPAGPGEFDQVRRRVEQDLVQALVADKADSVAWELYSAVQAGSSFDDAAAQFNAEILEPPPFSRSSTITGIGRDARVLGTAFSLTEPGQISEPSRYGSGSVIFTLRERTTPDLTTFNEKRDSVYSSVMVAKQQQLYNRWFTALMDSSDIVNNIELQRQQGTAGTF